MLRALAIVLCVVAVGCMVAAIIGISTGRPGVKAGWVLRTVAVVSFGAAVVLTTIAHH